MRRAAMWMLALAVVASCSEHSQSRPAPTPEKSQVRAAPGSRSATDVERVNVPVSGHEPSRGPASAPITMVVFSDFECPFCGRAVPTLKALEREYGPRLRVVWRNFPLDFHSHATLAAEAAMEAHAQGGNEKFWAMHDQLFAHPRALSQVDLSAYAKQIGLDGERFTSALNEHTRARIVEDDRQLGLRLGLQSTPVFFVNGRPLVGAQPLGAFKSLIDDELQRVAAVLARGVGLERLYTTLIADAAARASFGPVRPARSPVDATVYNIAVSATDPQRGPVGAPITYVVFGDFECEYTQQAMKVLPALEQKYGSELRVVWKNVPMPFHPHARDAARLAMAAFAHGGSSLFWRASDLLFKNRAAQTRADLEHYGRELGLDASELKAALDEGKYDGKLDEDLEQAKHIVFGLTSPILAVNGRVFKGAQKLEISEGLIQEELPRAKARLASGVPPARLYDELVKDGKLQPFEVAPGTLSADAKKIHTVAAPASAPRRGVENAKFVIQEFADFECPYCKQVEPTLRKLLEDNKDVELVWRNDPLPSHAHARLAAEAAQEAFVQGGNTKFWAYHDLLFENQGALTRPDLERYAQELGLDLAKFRAALDSHRHQAVLDADLAAVEQIGEQVGTPAFLVNGLLIAGAQSSEVFKVAVQRALLRRDATARAARP